MEQSDSNSEGVPASEPVESSKDRQAFTVDVSEDAFEEPEWAQGLGFTEENVREAFMQVGEMFRNMSTAEAEESLHKAAVAVAEGKRGRVTVKNADGTYSASYVVRGSTLRVRSAGAQRTLTLAKVSASIEEVVKQVLSAMIAQGQPVLRSTR
jgi:hypothetical protein